MKLLYKIQHLLLLVLLFATSKTFAQKQTVTSQQIMQGQTPKGINTAEWATVQNQIELGKYKNYADKKGGYASANPNNGFHIAYQADGSTQFSPYEQTDTDYSIRFKLEGVGYQKLNTLSKPQALHNQALSDGSKLTYQWDNNLTEWWTNRQSNTEQWFSLQQAPQGKTNNEPLRLRLGIKTDMKMKVQAGQLSFSKANKHIQYNKLKAWDAKGKTLAAHFVAVEGSDAIDLVVADQNATYPITIDPSVSQQAYIKASNNTAALRFGYSVAIDGNTMVVGAIGEASNATGVNGDQTNTSSSGAGAAYVFVRSGTTWTQQSYLKASNTESFDGFGASVAISGETIAVGAVNESSNATGINGTQTDNSLTNAGAVYVFVRSGTTWTQQAYLKASNTDGGDKFGSALAISGETIVVGAQFEDSNATGINGTQTNNSALDAGAAYVFVRSGTTWTQQAYLKASNTGADDQFGNALAISGETIVIGAINEDSNATGIGGSQTDNSTLESGAAYVFVRSGTTWTQQAYIKASNTDVNDRFGLAVAIDGETIVVGSNEDSNARGVNGDQTNNLADNSGAAYVFTRSGTTWTQQAYLKASNAEASDAFGAGVAISGETIVVGATGEDSNATGVDGDQTNNSTSTSGAAYVFTRSGTTWSQTAYLKASNPDANDQLVSINKGLAISGQTIVLAAQFEASNATGINGIQTNNSAASSGAVYVFLAAPPLTASTPTAQTATTNQAKTGNAATELAPTGGTSPYTYSNGSGDAACVAPSGATALTGLTVNTDGTYSYTAPATAGTYYYCIKVSDSATPTASSVTKVYTLTVTAGGSGGAISLSNTCPTATVNLTTSVSATNLPSGTTVTWHTGTPATTANKVANPAAVNTSGMYYAAFYDGINNCYSPASAGVNVTINSCSGGAINLSNTCPTATVNLTTSVSATNLPSGATVTWHTGTPATAANKVADPTAISTSGMYYMAFFDGTNNCYSETSQAVTVTITACASPMDLMPNFTFGGTSFTAGATKTMIINVNETKGSATTGVIEVFVPMSTGFTYTFDAAQTSVTVLGAETVNNPDWEMTTNASGILFKSKSGVSIPANGRSRIAVTVKADTAGTDGSITANITPILTESNAYNNISVVSISIQN